MAKNVMTHSTLKISRQKRKEKTKGGRIEERMKASSKVKIIIKKLQLHTYANGRLKRKTKETDGKNRDKIGEWQETCKTQIDEQEAEQSKIEKITKYMNRK